MERSVLGDLRLDWIPFAGMTFLVPNDVVMWNNDVMPNDIVEGMR